MSGNLLVFQGKACCVWVAAPLAPPPRRQNLTVAQNAIGSGLGQDRADAGAMWWLEMSATYTHTRAHAHTRTHTYRHTHMHTHTHTHTHTYTIKILGPTHLTHFPERWRLGTARHLRKIPLKLSFFKTRRKEGMRSAFTRVSRVSICGTSQIYVTKPKHRSAMHAGCDVMHWDMSVFCSVCFATWRKRQQNEPHTGTHTRTQVGCTHRGAHTHTLEQTPTGVCACTHAHAGTLTDTNAHTHTQTLSHTQTHTRKRLGHLYLCPPLFSGWETLPLTPPLGATTETTRQICCLKNFKRF